MGKYVYRPNWKSTEIDGRGNPTEPAHPEAAQIERNSTADVEGKPIGVSEEEEASQSSAPAGASSKYMMGKLVYIFPAPKNLLVGIRLSKCANPVCIPVDTNMPRARITESFDTEETGFKRCVAMGWILF